MAKKKSSALSRLIPGAFEITSADGTSVFVPSNADENKIMGMLMASKMRAICDAMITKIKDQDLSMTPKELADLATAVSKTEQFAAEIYKGPEVPLTPRGPDSAKQVGEEPVNFENLVTKPEPEKPKE